MNCLDMWIVTRSATYDRDAQSYAHQIQTPYWTYFNEADGVLMAYVCADSKFINMINNSGLDIPWWAKGVIGMASTVFRTLNFHYSLAFILSKSTAISADALTRVKSFVENSSTGFKWEKYSLARDFKQYKQGDTCKY